MMADHLAQAAVDIALERAKRGHFLTLAAYLRAQGIDPKITAWIAEGCRVRRGRGQPRRDAAVVQEVASLYRRLRSIFTQEEVAEKVIELYIAEWFDLDRREVRRIAAGDAHQREAYVAVMALAEPIEGEEAARAALKLVLQGRRLAP